MQVKEEKELIQIDTINNAYNSWFLAEDGLYEILEDRIIYVLIKV